MNLIPWPIYLECGLIDHAGNGGGSSCTIRRSLWEGQLTGGINILAPIRTLPQSATTPPRTSCSTPQIALVHSRTVSMSRIREVWAPQLDAEMRNIRELVEKYPYVAMVSVHTSCAVSRTLVTYILPGHRISWRRRAANWIIQDVLGLPLSDDAV